ncbi:MAG TPA: thiamine phosphate synthase [Planctomycetaceae bacterium]|nr:thiamine phosphate synthase [Planctomycetaceae bacterium]
MLPQAFQGGWTNGAERALARASRLAVLQDAAEVDPSHLLGALLLDDGRAGTTLAASGLNIDRVLPLDPDFDVGVLDAIEPTVPWGELLLGVLLEARQLADAGPQGAEAGTNHLLRSLSRAATSVTDHLAAVRMLDSLDTVAKFQWSQVATPTPLPDELRLQEREPIEVNPTELLRILDAAANRAREGLRVVEDYTRLGLNDRFLSEQLKTCRHDIAAAMAVIPTSGLLAARDTPNDVGTRIATLDEYRRTELADVLTAAFKRTEEALRTLEEYGKVVSGLLGRQMEQLRYRVYTLEKAVLRTESNRQRLEGQRLYVLVTESLCHHGSGPAIHGAIAAGVRMFQIREKTMKDRVLVEHARHVRRWTRDADGLLIINDRPDIAALVDADGVHLGQDELTVADARNIVGPDKLVGVSTHTIEQARQAVLDGADYLGVGPTFPTGTKSFTEFPGLAFVRQVAEEIALPWFAIGGINAENLASVTQAGATRVAVSGAVCGAEDPFDAASQLMPW